MSAVVLRPIREADLPVLAHRESADPVSPFDDFGFHGVGSLERAFREHGLLPNGGERGRLAVEFDGALIGSASWHEVQYGPNRGSRALNIGIGLFEGSRGRGLGRLALRAMAEYLFAHFDVERLEGSTDVTNVAMQRASEAVGFHREGILRRAQFRLGEHRDLVLYSLLRSDLSSAPTAKSAPEGASPHGHSRK